jgi:hypothetical protein
VAGGGGALRRTTTCGSASACRTLRSTSPGSCWSTGPDAPRNAPFSLGEEHTEESLHNLRTYYGFLGDWAEGVAMGAPRTPEAVREQAAAFEELEVDELVFDPTVASLDQVDWLADAVR